jgi:hypothetical protein
MRLLVAALLLLAAPFGEAQEASYRISGDQLPVSAAANGYHQTVIPVGQGSVEVRVATTLTPVGSTGSYAEIQLTSEVDVPDGFALPPKLRSRLRLDHDAFEAATRILEWVARHVRLDDRPAPQDAVSVLRRGWGRCSGVANAATALLLAAGFEARTVSGLLVTRDGVVPHRWLECRLPGAGWVPTDPTLGLWTVTPRHVVFERTVAAIPRVTVTETGRDGFDVLPRRRGRPVRPNLGSELVCRLVGGGAPARAIAVLYGRGGDVHRALLDPEGRFSSLLPGRWRLVVVAGGTVLEDRDLVLEESRSHTYAVHRSQTPRIREVGP